MFEKQFEKLEMWVAKKEIELNEHEEKYGYEATYSNLFACISLCFALLLAIPFMIVTKLVMWPFLLLFKKLASNNMKSAVKQAFNKPIVAN